MGGHVAQQQHSVANCNRKEASIPLSLVLRWWTSCTCPRVPLPAMSLALDDVACADFVTKVFTPDPAALPLEGSNPRITICGSSGGIPIKCRP